jgi:hypothetical protein
MILFTPMTTPILRPVYLLNGGRSSYYKSSPWTVGLAEEFHGRVPDLSKIDSSEELRRAKALLLSAESELQGLREQVERLEQAVAASESDEVNPARRALTQAAWTAPILLSLNLPNSVFAGSVSSPVSTPGPTTAPTPGAPTPGAPTSAPTSAPTGPPTSAPTGPPTIAPTSAPTPAE